MSKRNVFAPALLAVAVALFVVVNLVASPVLRAARVDLTEGKLHTLSHGTVNIIKGLELPMDLTLYWSRSQTRDLPGIDLFGSRVKELLEEYETRSKGNIRVAVVDPEPFSEKEDEAVSLGLTGAPVRGSRATVYLGLAGKHADGRTMVIPFLQPDREQFLEYDISQMINSLSHPGKVGVGLLSAFPLTGGPSPQNPFQSEPPWMITDQLHKQFDLKVIDEGDSIPEGIDVLMVVRPRDLGPEALYQVDQYVLGGGRALVFTDPVSEFSGPQGFSRAGTGENGAVSLLAAWGVKMEEGQVVGDLEVSQRVSYRGRSRTETANYLPWLSLRGDHINHEELFASGLETINLASAGSLTKAEGAVTSFVPILTSSSRSMLIDGQKIAFMPDPGRLLSEFSPGGKSYTMAARIIGPAGSAFPDGPPPSAKDSDGEVKPDHVHLEKSGGDINVIVVADTDLLQDQFWVQVQNFFGQRIALPYADNADLVMNALDQLGGSPDLIGLRGRSTVVRPFTLLDQVAQEAELAYRTKEKQLLDRLDEAEEKLNELQSRREDPESPELTPEQEKELENIRQEKVKVRKELRSVQYELDKDIERLEAIIKFANIGLMPLLVILTAAGGTVLGKRRRRKVS
ncbi:MAG: Gldg family protein [bacterium]|nr:Gldg family protein [bacterium]MDT8395410.1 Gldg family protein [bacterium]